MWNKYRSFSACRAALSSLLFATTTRADQPIQRLTIHPDQPKQVIRGIGFEIQSDSIGSGNQGLPDHRVSVPHDLVPAERTRLATEMLKNFRYCRLAGGLYWRGLDSEEKSLRPRWPEQLAELRELLGTAGVEGICFEYWSPAPFWKANQSYAARTNAKEHKKLNVLRPFAPGFDNDPIYAGDADRFFTDFADAVVGDIRTLENAGLKVAMWGLQNEPNINHADYPSCGYNNPADYLQTYRAVAGAIRQQYPKVLLFADTDKSFPGYIAPGMKDPGIASLVDAYAIHDPGCPADDVPRQHAKIARELPPRPWFQNEYEYLRGGATPDRCLNTVEHILNSFQIAENPVWFWIHALKPIQNAEASGYSLGFWKSLDQTTPARSAVQFRRWPDGPAFTELPDTFKTMEMVSAKRAQPQKPAAQYDFSVNQPVSVYLLAAESSDAKLVPDWRKTELSAAWEGGRDIVYKRSYPAGRIDIPSAGANAAPHLCFIEASSPQSLQVEIGVNVPIQVRSQAIALEEKIAGVKPGHWIYNPYNWNAVGSFVKRMPWDSVALNVSAGGSAEKSPLRHLAFRKPDGKVTVVVANRDPHHSRSLDMETGLGPGAWKGYRYTPEDAGEGTMGAPIGTLQGSTLKPVLPPLSWEFWEQE